MATDTVLPVSEINEPLQTTAPLPRLYSTEYVSEYLGVSLRTVKRFISSGKLPVRRFGRAIRIKDEDLRRFLDEGTCQKNEGIEPGDSSSSAGGYTVPRQSVGKTAPLDRRLVFQLAQQTASRRVKPSSNTG